MAVPTIAPAMAAALVSAAGGVAGGVGAGLAAKSAAKSKEKMLQEELKGPIRGGSERAGNADELGLMRNQDTIEKLGAASIPMKSPVYGAPLDLNDVFKQNPFGQGYSAGNKYNV